MTAAQRAHLRAEIDKHKRANIAEAKGKGYCIQCGAEHANETFGCAACHDRQRRRERRRTDTRYRSSYYWRREAA